MYVMAKKKPRKGRPPLDEVRVSVQLRLNQDLLDAFDHLAADNSRTRNAEVALALQAHLRAAGRWPLTPKGDS
jgi:hypothetical protein